MITDDDLKRRVASYAGTDEQAASSFVDALWQSIRTHLDADEEVEVQGLGTFAIARPSQSELRRPAFRPDDKLREAVNAPFACFDPVVIGTCAQAPEVDARLSSGGLPPTSSADTDRSDGAATPSIDAHATDAETHGALIFGQAAAINSVPTASTCASERADDPHVANTPADRPVGTDKALGRMMDAGTRPAEQDCTTEQKKEPLNMNTKPHDYDDYNERMEEEAERKEHLLYRRRVRHGSPRLPWSIYIGIAVALGLLIFILVGLYQLDHTVQYDVDTYRTETPASVDSAGDGAPVQASPSVAGEGDPSDLDAPSARPDDDHTAEASTTAAPDAGQAATVAPTTDVTAPAGGDKPGADGDVSDAVRTPTAEPQSGQSAATTPTGQVKVSSASGEGQFMIGSDGKPVSLTIARGQRLTTLALEYYGDKAFWPYIFDANSSVLKDPDNIPAGVTISMPSAAYYGIDANDPASIRRANNRAGELLRNR